MSNRNPHPFQEHPLYPDYCAFAVGEEDYCKREKTNNIHNVVTLETARTTGFEEYLPLTPVRIAPGEYEIRARDGRVLWRVEGAALADWVCASVNGYAGAVSFRNLALQLVKDRAAEWEDKAYRCHERANAERREQFKQLHYENRDENFARLDAARKIQKELEALE